MIVSMTAFAREQVQSEWGSMVCEIRSINHRYLEASVHLPESLRALEMTMRELVRKHVQRGKIECAVRLKMNPSADASLLDVNLPLAKALCAANEKVAALLRMPAPINSAEILRFPGVLESKETDIERLQTEAVALVEKTLGDLVAARQREGKELTGLFLQRIEAMEAELAKVKTRLPAVLVEQREKLLKRFADAKLELDQTRLEQEMVIFAQRMDVAEEIDRTHTHLTEIKRILKTGGAAGRRLDFLMQELNREANTLGSKSTDSVLTHAAVELKVLIEQMREQVQNVE